MRAIWLACVLALPISACGQVAEEIPEPRVKPAEQTESELDAKFKQIAQDISNAPEKLPTLDGPLNINLNVRLQIGCAGVAKQGGAVLCQTRPNQKVKVGRSAKDFYYEMADENGQIIVGFDRDEKRAIIDLGNGDPIEYKFDSRSYDVSHVTGLPPSQVGNYTKEQLARIRASSARKKAGFASRAQAMGFKNGFIHPVKEYRKTTNFGAFRTYNGQPGKPHMGVDMAAAKGTPIYAPADGTVSMADDDLYFEGAMVLLDHGQGLISMYLHVDKVMVKPGQVVKQGDQIATIGSKGRSTGPHLCWRLKWRNRNLDPELLTQWPGQ